MQVVSMIVNDQFGVMQRVMGEFTRKKINVETIVVGKCELEGKARVVLAVLGMDQAKLAVERLERMHDIFEIDILDETRHEAYALVTNEGGKARLIGSIPEVAKLIEAMKPEKYIEAVNAL